MNRIDELTGRLDRLERANRWYRRLLAGIAFMAVAVVGVNAAREEPPADVPDVIRAKSFEVVDDEGRALVHLFSTAGVGAIGTADTAGNLLVALVADQVRGEFVGAISTLNSAGNRLVHVGAGESGRGTLHTFDGDGTRLVGIEVSETGNGMIFTADNAGRQRVVLGAGADGHGAVAAYTAVDLPAIQLGGHSGGGVIQVNNYAGVPICTIDPDDRGHGRIELLDRTGKGRVLTPGR